MKKGIVFFIIIFCSIPLLSKEAVINNEQREIPDSSLLASSFESSVRKKASLLRFGFGAPPMISIYNSELNRLYDGWAGFLDFYFYRIRSRKGNGLDFYTRMHLRYFWSNDKRMMKSMYISDFTSRIFMGGADAGVRLIYGFYFLHEFWQIYILGAPRFLYTHIWTKEEDTQSKLDASKSRNKRKSTKNYYSLGAMGGGGIEITILPSFGIFAEYNIGCVPVGKSKPNVEGHQFYAGVTLRTDVK